MRKAVIILASIIPVLSFAQSSIVNKVGGRYDNGFAGAIYSYIDGKTLTFGLSEKAANEQSIWKSDDKNPPVAVREAIAIAKRKLIEIFPEQRRWTFKDITLCPVIFTLDAPDRIELWQYHVTFERHREPRNPHFDDVDGKVTLVVLMDGTAVHPVIKSSK